MSLKSVDTLTGPEKAAVLLLSLSERYSSRIMAQLEDNEIRDVSLIMATLGPIPSDIVETVYAEFADDFSTSGGLVGTFATTERALLRVMDRGKVNAIMKEIRGPADRTMWDKMGHIDEKALVHYLKNEYPQTIAVVLSKIKTDHAARVLALLPEDLAADVLLRLLKMDTIRKEILGDIEHTLKTEFMSDKARDKAHDPYKMLANIFSAFERSTGEKYMALLEERDREAATRIRSLMFTFDDLSILDTRGIKTIIKRVDAAQLAMALKGAQEATKALFFKQMSLRASRFLKDDIEALGMVKLRHVDEAQQSILTLTKKLARCGEILMPEGTSSAQAQAHAEA